MFEDIEDSLIGKCARFIGASDIQVMYGGSTDPRKHLELDISYLIVNAQVGQSRTTITLQGFERFTFNSVCFDII